jgi:hypothetical protein
MRNSVLVGLAIATLGACAGGGDEDGSTIWECQCQGESARVAEPAVVMTLELCSSEEGGPVSDSCSDCEDTGEPCAENPY